MAGRFFHLGKGSYVWWKKAKDANDKVQYAPDGKGQESHSAFAPWLLRQFDPVVVLLITLVFLGQNLSEPMRLAVSDRLIHKRGRLTDDEIFATHVAP